MKFLLLATLFIVAACVPKAEEIQGCGSGQEFSDITKSCVAATSISFDSTLTTLSVTEDDPDGEAFTLPSATTNSPDNQLFWFITRAPENGTLVGCADLDGSGAPTGTGTVLRSCVYTPTASYVGADSFAYRVCTTEQGNKRCTASVNVTVTVADDLADPPRLVVPTALSIEEGRPVRFDVRVLRETEDEANNFYLCVDVNDPDSALNSPTVTNANNPGDPITVGDATCSLLGDEMDDLNVALASFFSNTFFLPTNANKTLTIQTRLCEAALLPDCAASSQSTTTTVTITNKNFSPVMTSASPPISPKVLTAINEDSPILTLGVSVVDDLTPATQARRLEPTATDADPLDTVTYELVPLSFFPTHSGTLLCVSGTNFSCTFNPAADYSGSVSFRYRAKDNAGALSSEVAVSFTVTAINDVPQVKSGQVFDYATPASQVSLNENTVLANRSFNISEGGGASENSQVLRLRATTDNLTVLPPDRITVKRSGVVVGTLSSTTWLTLDPGNVDADALSFTLSFEPVANTISLTPINVTFELSDGTDTITHAIAFTSVDNVDSPIAATIVNPNLGMQQSATSKDLVLRASPGANDWDDIPNGAQPLSILITSATPSVIDLTESSLSFAGTGVTSITRDAGCAANSCRYTIVYNGTDDPVDDDLLLTLEPSARGTSVLTLTFSDGVGSNVVRTTTIGVYNYAVVFNGWADVRAKGRTVNKAGTMTAPASATITWENLTVTEGGVATTDYKVRVFRNSVNNFSPYPVTGSVETDGVVATTRSFTFQGGVTYDDATSIDSGDTFYVALAIVPNNLGEEIYPGASPDRGLEIVIPPDNMALVHAWMANKFYCAKTGQTASRANNYRCLNAGIGGNVDAGSYYHELETHLMVDMFEAGCPYQFTEDERVLSATSNLNFVHYERDTGECTYSDNTNWLPYDAVAAAQPSAVFNAPGLPPLVGLTRAEAQAVCEASTPTCAGAACAGTWTGIARELPTRSESVRSADWEPSYTSPLTAVQIEDSADHTSAVRACNTRGVDQASARVAAGLASTSFMSSSPNSTILSFLTSTTESSNCKSRYGIFNLVGNVTEWQADVYDCSGAGATANCVMSSPVQAAGSLVVDDSDPANNSLTHTYAFNGLERGGPALTKSVTATFASLFRSDIDRLYVAAGLPFYEDSTVPHPARGIPRIGSTAPPASLNAAATFSSDSYRLNWNGANVNYAMTYGGHWGHLAGAGRFNFDLIEATQTSTQVGHRCVMRKAANP